MVNIIKNRPRQYQKIKDIHSFIKKLKFHEEFYMRTIDTGCHGYILKKEKVGKYIRIYYRTKINH